VVASFANIHLNLLHIPSGLNVADPPSRTLSLQDTKLAGATWATIRRHFGGQFGHSIDLMALPSNAMVDFQGSRLPFISRFPTPGCLGVNFFAQSPLHYPSNIFSNPYVPTLLEFAFYDGRPRCITTMLLVACYTSCVPRLYSSWSAR
jgi:hypothetical protein